MTSSSSSSSSSSYQASFISCPVSGHVSDHRRHRQGSFSVFAYRGTLVLLTLWANVKATVLVMNNVFSKAERIDERYDLKGSTLGRKTLVWAAVPTVFWKKSHADGRSPSAVGEQFSCTFDRPLANLMLKDLDLVDRFRIKLGRERKACFLRILTHDAEVRSFAPSPFPSLGGCFFTCELVVGKIWDHRLQSASRGAFCGCLPRLRAT